MKPMEPMKPMAPLSGDERWWPAELGDPSTSGGQDGMRYAFFPDRRRLLVEEDGAVTGYDSGDHRIDGVQQRDGGVPAFSSQHGAVRLDELKTIG